MARPAAVRPKKKETARTRHRRLLRQARPHYDLMLAAQGGVCAICKRPPTNPARRFDIDHDHVAMFVRGVLCVRCNKDLTIWLTLDRLIAAVEYLRNPPAVAVLEEVVRAAGQVC